LEPPEGLWLNYSSATAYIVIVIVALAEELPILLVTSLLVATLSSTETAV